MPVHSVPQQSAVSAGGGGSQVEVVQQRLAGLSLSTTPTLTTRIQERLLTAIKEVGLNDLPLLGRGKYAEVRKITLDGHPYAVKVLIPEGGKSCLEGEAEVINDLAKQSGLRNLPEYVEAVKTCETRAPLIFMKCIEGENLYQLMTFRGFTMRMVSHWSHQNPVNEEEKRRRLCSLQKLARDISAAISDLHRLGFMHRDVNPDNIQVSHIGDMEKIKFTLLGLSLTRPYTSINKAKNSLTPYRDENEVLGDPYSVRLKLRAKDYASPEIHSRNYDQKVDVWSFGMLLYELALGGVSMQVHDEEGNLRVFSEGRFQMAKEVLPEPLVELMDGCLKKDPKQRFSIEEVLAHPFLTKELPV